ncbi:hypothetical protein G5V59_14600 [Nocardioides sp. W3-2-3]|uniref:aldo/keto reductase n=1 Tax=Nocardioides convexus TaxID=2712224 RepID=UPI002418599F|nr:aldo/keto reductase [Nocardioides convexus]NHA00771.1 hypothetical protein [Nocardioides convexus]
MRASRSCSSPGSGSSRLPGKALLSVAGRPMVVLAAQRAGNAGHPVLVATSDQPEDDVIAAACTAADVAVVRGPLDDPLARFVLAAEGLADDDVVVRLTADNVVPDGDVVGQARRGPGGLRATLRPARRRRPRPAVRRRSGGLHRRAAPRGGRRRELRLRARARHPVDARAGGRPAHLSLRHRRVGRAALHGRHLRRLRRPGAGPGRHCGPGRRRLAHPVRPRGCRDRACALPCRCARTPSASPLWCSAPSRLGVPYGAANTGGLPSDAEVSEVLAAVRRNRITHLDTARGYGASEQRLGAALRRGLSEHAGVVTKVLPLTDGQGADAARASVATSLRLLGASSVAGLLVHRAADWHRPGVADETAGLVADGTARVAGASLSTPEEAPRPARRPALPLRPGCRSTCSTGAGSPPRSRRRWPRGPTSW